MCLLQVTLAGGFAYKENITRTYTALHNTCIARVVHSLYSTHSIFVVPTVRGELLWLTQHHIPL